MNEDQEGTVVLGFGAQPVEWLSKASKIAGKGAVIDPDVARMAGANLAVGEPGALAALRKRLEAGSLKATAEAIPGASTEELVWLAKGERGISSETIFSHLTGIDALRGNRPDIPYDPDDLRRCLLLLEQVPRLKPKFDRMRSAKPREWVSMVDAWPEIVSTFEKEAPEWRVSRSWVAPMTYQLMRKARGH